MKIASTLGLLVLGLASGLGLPRLLAAPARAAGVQRWEYNCLAGLERKLGGVTDTANALGRDGWEMAATVAAPAAPTVFCFKRPLP
jgi:hypothetical protein